MPDTELLTDQQIAEIAAGSRLDQCLKVVSNAIPNCFCRRPAGHLGTHSESVPSNDVFWIHPAIPALIATVKQLRTALSNADRVVVEAVEVNGNLQSQLEQLRAENERLKSGRMIVRDDAEQFIQRYLHSAQWEGETLMVTFENEALIAALIGDVEP